MSKDSVESMRLTLIEKMIDLEKLFKFQTLPPKYKTKLASQEAQCKPFSDALPGV